MEDATKQLGLDAPTGDMQRDLEDGRKILLRRGQPCEEVRIVGESGDREIVFVASTGGSKRDGNLVHNDGWDFTEFAKNPIMLYCHDYGSAERVPTPPIGHWVSWEIDGSGESSRLVMRGKFAEHEFADVIYKLYEGGHMWAVSIGWTPLEYEPLLDEDERRCGWRFLKNALLECSAVPIPADPERVAE